MLTYIRTFMHFLICYVSCSNILIAVAVATSNCAREPIQIPGAIQDVGLLFVVERGNTRILQV